MHALLSAAPGPDDAAPPPQSSWGPEAGEAGEAGGAGEKRAFVPNRFRSKL